MKKFLQRKFIKFLTKHLFNSLTEEDILKAGDRGSIIYKGRNLTKKEIQQITKDAREFKNSIIWKLLKEDATYQAQQRMFRKSENLNDIYAGKLMLHSIDIIDKTISKVSNL